jgi:cytochrome c-type biogenesis protein CcmF
MATLGRGALVLALLLAAWAAGSGFLGAVRRDRRLQGSARRALYMLGAALLVADAVLMTAIIRHDFSFVVVYDTTARNLPFGYLVTSFWASQAGSLLLWVSVLTAFSVAVLRTNRKQNGELMPWVTGILGAIATFFLTVLVVAADPFATQPAPADGAGLNPSLQNPYMIAHPPSLYLGYVGLAVPYTFCMAALLARRSDARWIVATRRWTLAAWGFLGVGMLLGAHWAYVEVGWGGFWAWDPVENAALMPWLVATAFLHSVIVQEKKGMLKVWNVVLVTVTFALSLFGTFLTRSGVLSSIHAFTVSSVGWYFVVFIAIVLAGSAWLILSRLDLLRSEHRMESLVSREATFLFNNLLFVGLAFAILWGVAYPLALKAVGAQQVTVNSPFYNFFAAAFGLPLILLMAVGPLIAWRRASLRSLRLTFGVPFCFGLLVGAILLAAGFRGNLAGIAAISLCAFAAASIMIEFARGTRARRALAGGTWPRAFFALVTRNRRRYGGYIVHLAVVLIVLGVVGTMAFGTAHEWILKPGAQVSIRDYRLRFLGVQQAAGPNYTEQVARIDVTRGGSHVGVLGPAQRTFPILGGTDTQTSNEVDIRTNWRTGEDLFLILDAARPDGSVAIKALINPMVNLLWMGALVFVAGALVAAWPDRREARRLARRYAEEPVAGEA